MISLKAKFASFADDPAPILGWIIIWGD